MLSNDDDEHRNHADITNYLDFQSFLRRDADYGHNWSAVLRECEAPTHDESVECGDEQLRDVLSYYKKQLLPNF